MKDKNIIWLIVSMVTAGLEMGCASSETEFYAGHRSDVYLNLVSSSDKRLQLTADGSPQEVRIESNVAWEVLPVSKPFSCIVEGSVNNTCKGDGVVVVTATPNVNKVETPTAQLMIKAIDFNEELVVALDQKNLIFSMEPEKLKIREEGDSVDLKFKSSIEWQFLPNNSEWVEFDPAYKGDGSWDDIKVRVVVKPNYTTSERVFSFQLFPENSEFLEYNVSAQDPVELIQTAGTLPTDIRLTASEPTNSSIPLSLSYKSNSPIVSLELEIYDSNKSEVRVISVPNTDGDVRSLPIDSTVDFTLTDLESGVYYIVTPIVTSKVGTNRGEPIGVQTHGDVNFIGPKVNAYNITPYFTGVDASFSVSSDIEMTSVKVMLCEENGETVLATRKAGIEGIKDLTGTVVSWESTLNWENDVVLSQNTRYFFKINIVSNNPNTPAIQNSLQTEIGPFDFTTLFRLPETEDNHPIN